MQLQYSQNDYLNISVGRYTPRSATTTRQITTAPGSDYYGTPLPIRIRRQGRTLPIHNVGRPYLGHPVRRCGLHYVVEIGNGRDSRSYVPPLGQNATAVQNYVDENPIRRSMWHSSPGLTVFADYRWVFRLP